MIALNKFSYYLVFFALISFIYPLGIQLNGVLFSTVELCLGIMIMCALSLLVNFQEVLFFFRTRLLIAITVSSELVLAST